MATCYIAKTCSKCKRIKEDLIDAWDEARSGNGQDSFFADEFGSTDGNTDIALGLRDEF